MSSKLYIGNLPAEVNEASLRQLLQDHSLVVNSVLIKRGGYAFIDCPEQSIIDQAIEKLNGYSFMGSTLVVEPSVAGGGRRSLNARTIIVSNVPLHVRVEDLERLLTPVGVVQKCDKAPAKRDPQPTPCTQTIEVVYEAQEQAEAAVTQLNNTEFEGNILKVESVMERRGGSAGGGGGGGGGSSVAGRGARGGARGGAPGQGLPFTGAPAGPQRQPDFPLRILVLSEMVGAIIGRQGGTIRQITQQTRARVDVHRKDNVGSLEKAITIYGNPENCTNACRKILEVMQQEADNTNKGEVSLKLLAHNNLIGRIIGKGGNTIKKIMQDTDTKITVSSADVEPTAFSMGDVSSFNMERVITIKGSIDNMSRAEALISAKLRQSYENDLQAMAPQSMMFPGLHPMAMMSTVGMGFPRGGPPAPSMYGPPAAPFQPMYPPGAPMPTGTQQETSYLYIPNNAVGAIIGSKGSHIRNIIRFSGASVKIAALPEGAADPQQERKVTIVGTPEAQWKAQYLIFEKMREEGFMSPGEEVRMTVELLVPSSQVGRIIGKGGQNVRELQRSTSCTIKLPEHGASAGEETTVHIIGAFYASQSAQRRIRAMISQPAATGGGPTPPSGRLRALSGSGSASGSATGPAAGAPGANNRSRDREPQQ